MKLRVTTGIAVIVFGLLIAFGPQFIFKACTPMMDGHFMKCHWSAQAEIGTGSVIAVLGILLLVFSCLKVRLGLALGVLLSGINAILIPNVLIGGCSHEAMECRKITFPAITVISILLLIIVSGYLILLFKEAKNVSKKKGVEIGGQTDW